MLTRNTTETDNWYLRHGPYIIWQLNHAANDFFKQQRTRATYHAAGGCAKISLDAATLLQRACGTTTAITELPHAFQLVIQSGQVPQPGPAVPGPAPLYFTGGAAPTWVAQTQHPPANTYATQPQRTAQLYHPSPVPFLVQLFATLQQDATINGYYKRTRHFLAHQHITTEAALTQMGLTNQDCFNFHVRGMCQGRTCQNSHVVKQFNMAGAQALHTALLPALTTLQHVQPPPNAIGGRGAGRGGGRRAPGGRGRGGRAPAPP